MKSSTKGGIDRYIENHCLPGSFLMAVLSNDLKESFARADKENREDLFEIVSYCHNHIPLNCWGSPEKVGEWLEV